MDAKYYTVKEAANLLQVSHDTIRRRIRSGELTAEKQIGAYGDQWMLPANQFNVATQDIPVQRVTRQVGVGELEALMTQAIAAAIQQETKPLKDEIAALKTMNENLLAGMEKIITSQTLSEARGEVFMSNLDKNTKEIVSTLTDQAEKSRRYSQELSTFLINSEAVEREHFRLLDERLRETQLARQKEAEQAESNQRKTSFFQRLFSKD